MAIYVSGEKRYQWIRLMLSSGASLSDANTLFRIAAVGLERGQVNETDAKSLDEIRQRLERLTNLGMSRSQAKANKLLRFKPKPNLMNRNEETAQWLADLTGVVPFGQRWLNRPLAAQAHSKPYKRAEPHVGSFKKRAPPPIAKIYGAKEVNKDLKALMDTIGMLIKNHSPDSKSRAAGERMLASAGKSISTRVSKGG